MAEFFAGLAGLATLAEPIGLVDVMDALDRQAGLAVHGAHAAQRSRSHGRAVIGVLATDEMLLGRLTHAIPIDAGHPKHGVVRFRARIGEEHLVHMGGRLGTKCLGKLGHWWVRRLEESIVIRQLTGLC